MKSELEKIIEDWKIAWNFGTVALFLMIGATILETFYDIGTVEFFVYQNLWEIGAVITFFCLGYTRGIRRILNKAEIVYDNN